MRAGCPADVDRTGESNVRSVPDKREGAIPDGSGVTRNVILFVLPDGRELRRKFWRLADPFRAMMRSLQACERAVYKGRWSSVCVWSESVGGGRFIIDYIAPEGGAA